MDPAVGMLEVIAPLCWAMNDNICHSSPPALWTSERVFKRTIDKMAVPEVPCEVRAVCEASGADETEGILLRLGRCCCVWSTPWNTGCERR